MQPEQQPDHHKIISPFANTEAAMVQASPRKFNPTIWIISGLLVIALCVTTGFYVNKYLNDRFRTLEVFPVAKYLEGPHTLSGSRFKAELRVEANLGWKETAGTLMLFTTTDDSNPLAVMVPADLMKTVSFSKGQTYMAELEVKEGGLIYANAVQKN